MVMEDGGILRPPPYGWRHPPKDRVRMLRYFVGDTFRWFFVYHYPKPLGYGHPSLCILWKKRMWSFVLPRTMPIGHPLRFIWHSLPYGLGHPFLNSSAKVNRIRDICKRLKEKVPPIEGSTFIFNKIQKWIYYLHLQQFGSCTTLIWPKTLVFSNRIYLCPL